MKRIQVTAKNVQKAIEQGLIELNATQDEVDIKILDEGGFFKKAKVELILDRPDEKQEKTVETQEEKTKIAAEKTNPKQNSEKKAESSTLSQEVEKKETDAIGYGTRFLKTLCEKMNVEAEITNVETADGITFNASGEKVSTLIGKRGETLNAIQEILANVMKKAGFREQRFFFDVENYKNRREMSLISLAERMAKKAQKIEKPIKLERMNAYERRIIHTALQSFEGVTTKSEGEEPNRYLVIIPIKED